jgi:hypothetical protein
MTYNEWVFAVQKLLNYEATDTDLIDILIRMIEYAELRIYTELDFVSTLTTTTTTLTSGTRSVQQPTNVIVVQAANIITPYTTTNPELGTRSPLNRRSIDYLNLVYNSATGSATPREFAIIGAPTTSMGITTAANYNILFGPWPDQDYTLEVVGTIRPTPLSETNTTTFLTTYCPHLFLAATMIYGSAFQRDFGAQSDNPQMAQSWENQYSTLRQGVNIEDLRMKSASYSWSPFIPTPQANVSRDRAGSAAPQA